MSSPKLRLKLKQPSCQLNVLDLFCGCGGMSKGLTDSGLNVICGIDIWDKAITSYQSNFKHKAICQDITKLEPQNLHNQINHVPIDIIVGGPPCQGFSIAGKRDNKDPRNSLFMEYVKYVEYFKPKAFVMENVIGILSMKTQQGESVIDIIIQQFSNAQYDCTITKLYASDFEVPQNRRRVLIFGIRKDLNKGKDISVPQPVLSLSQRIAVGTVLQQQIDIPINYYLSDKAIQGIINKKLKSKAKGHGFGAQILDINKPSYTIPARYWKDGYDALVEYPATDNTKSQLRRLTILELKRIQSFPDDYKILGSNKDIIIQIGNAVPCRLAYHIGKHLIKLCRNF